MFDKLELPYEFEFLGNLVIQYDCVETCQSEAKKCLQELNLAFSNDCPTEGQGFRLQILCLKISFSKSSAPFFSVRIP